MEGCVEGCLSEVVLDLTGFLGKGSDVRSRRGE